MFNIIAACDDNNGIGLDGVIPWAQDVIGREDMREFRIQTTYGVVIMGRKTYQSIGGPLSSRCNIVVSRNQEYRESLSNTGVYAADSLENALTLAQERIKESIKTTFFDKLNGKIWVIGGSELYDEALQHPKLHRAYISRIRGDFKCDVFMPKIDVPQVGGYSFGFDNCIDVEIYGNDDEDKYLNLLKRLMTAPIRPNRTGIRTRGLFAEKLEFSLTRGNQCILPLLTTKRVPVRLIISELLWFLGGKCTDTRQLLENNCHIWDGNTTREFLDSRGLSEYSEGECGPIYGYQWRSWNRPYTPMVAKTARRASIDVAKIADTTIQSDKYTVAAYSVAPKTEEAPVGIDQLARVISVLRTDPYDRRMIVSAWNPEQLPLMALPPCHWSFQFHCEANQDPASNQKYTLNCLLNMRSADVALGVPFNIASYALLTHMVAKCVNMRPGRLVIIMADCHLYENHISGAQEQIGREPGQFPTIQFEGITEGGEIDQFTRTDQIIIGAYQPHGVIKYPMAV